MASLGVSVPPFPPQAAWPRSDASSEHEVDECWICLSSAGQLTRPCACPRVCHRECIATWQLTNYGRREENFCRFCNMRLPALWKPDATQEPTKEELRVAPVMAVRYNGPEGTREFKLRVRPGPEGLAVFKAHLKEILGFDVGPEFDVTFECQMPATGSLVTLTGLNAYGAATHCAALLAASKAGTTAIAAPTAAQVAPATGISSPSSRAQAPVTGAMSGAPATGSHGGRPAAAGASTPAARQASEFAHRIQQPLPAVARPLTTVAVGGPGRRACRTGYTALQTIPRHSCYFQRGTNAPFGGAPAPGCNPRGARHVLYGGGARARLTHRSASDTALDDDSRADFDDDVDYLLPYACHAFTPEPSSPLPPLDDWTTTAAAGARGGPAVVGRHQGCQRLPSSPGPTAARLQPVYSPALGSTSLSSPPSPSASAPASRASDRPATAASVSGSASGDADGGSSAPPAACGNGQDAAATAAAMSHGSAGRQPQPHQKTVEPLRVSSSGRLRLPSVLYSTARRTMNSLIRALRHSAK